MKRKILFLVGLAALFAVLIIAFAPVGVKAFAEHKVEGLVIGDVTFATDHIALTRCSVNRPNLKGTIDEIRVFASSSGVSNVEIEGGLLTLDLQGESSKDRVKARKDLPPISAKNLLVSVRTTSAQVVLNNVSFTDYTKPEFQGFTALIYDPSGKEHKVTGHQGSYVDGVLTAHDIFATETPPFDIPGVPPGPQEISAAFVQAEVKDPGGMDGRRIEAHGVFIGDLVEIDRVKVLTGLPTAEIHHLVLNHPYLDQDTTFEEINAQVFFKDSVTLGLDWVLMTVRKDSVEGFGHCNDWADAIPDPVDPAFAAARPYFKGDLSWTISREPELDISIKNECTFECSAEPIKTLINTIRANGDFTYQAYNKDGKLFDRRVGPRLGNWVRYGNLPPWVSKAFVTLEDPGFWRHRGIIPQALENSLKENIKLGKFHRGGSTITMQLAKNLWLTRGKSLNRKAQELLMALMLESCLTKQELFEIYVNVIEFGADLYGIGAASRKYFDTYPEHLNQEEAFYLASILPNPRKAVRPENGGLERTRRLMKRLADNGRLEEEDITVSEAPDPIQDVEGEEWIAED